MSARTSSSTIFFGDDTTEVRARAGKTTARNPNAASVSHIFGGGAEPEEVKLTTRIREPGGTGGKSTLFDPDPVVVQAPSQRPVQPNPLTEAPEEPVRLSTKPLQPGGTGGKSSVFHDDDEPAETLSAAGKAQRNPSPFATDETEPEAVEPVRTSAKILRPGGTGGVSNVFIADEPPPPPVPARQLSVSSPVSDTGSVSGEENKKYVSKRSGGGPSQVFASAGEAGEDDEAQTWSGRKVEAGRTNMSQVALGGGYPDSEPQNRTARRGNIRADYNQSQIMFGDDTGGAPVQDRSNRTSSRVLRPGGTGGGSQIAFGDDTGGEPAIERKAGTSTKVLRPGGLGGTSQITFGDDMSGVSADGKPVTTSRVNRPGGTGGTSQISFAHDNAPEPTGPTKTSSRVLRPGGTGGASQITF